VKLFVDQKSMRSRVIRHYSDRKRKAASRRRPSYSIESGCYCDITGCSGAACEYLNGCVCNITGKCWGNNCPDSYENLYDDLMDNDQHSERSELLPNGS